jgi:hypothetical protein
MEELLAFVGASLGVSLGLGLVRAVGRGLAAIVPAPGPQGARALPLGSLAGPKVDPASRVTQASGVGGYTHVSRRQTWYLHGRTLLLPGRRERRIFYFAREPRPGELLDQVPAGYQVVENSRTGMRLLKRSD